MIPPDILQAIEQRIDIVEFISAYIPLKRRGNNYTALCPFHKEKSPSFSVSPSRQIFHCFGCGKGGGIIRFLMEYEKLDFIEAVQMLAKRAGVQLPQYTGMTNPAGAAKTTQLYEINQKAADFYHVQLKPQQDVLKYLQARSIDHAAIEKFKLGYAPAGPSALVDFLRKDNVQLKAMDIAKLVYPSRDGGFIDLFRNRLIIPICDVKSNIIGFGARTLKENDTPKYINSPETPLYTKRNVLFGLNHAKDAIIKEDYVIVVEGYFDVIVPFMHGIRNIVASSGTAFTEEQIRLLKRYTHNVVLVYDADAAGKLANLRGVDLLLEQEMEVKVINLPAGADPDSFVRREGAKAFADMVSQAENFFEYKFKVLKEQYPLDTPQDRAKILHEMLASCKKVSNKLLQNQYLQLLADKFSMREEVLYSYLQGMPEKPFESEPAEEKKHTEISKAEKMIITAFCYNAPFSQWLRDTLTEEDFISDLARKFFQVYKAYYALENKEFDITEFVDLAEDASLASLVSHIALSDEFKAIEFHQIEGCIANMRLLRMKHRLSELNRSIKTAEKSKDAAQTQALLTEYTQLLSAYSRHQNTTDFQSVDELLNGTSPHGDKKREKGI